MPAYLFMHDFRDNAGVVTCSACGETPEVATASAIALPVGIALDVCSAWAAQFSTWTELRQAIREVSAERPADYLQGIDPGATRPKGWR